MTIITSRRVSLFALTLGAVALATIGVSSATPKFFNDDPIARAPETQNASGMKPAEVSLFVDLTYNLIARKTNLAPRHAGNVNTIDEVPDSSWFTNRIGRLPLTAADVASGPDTGDGPAPGTWTVTSSKSDGVTPGFTVKDSNGQRWFLKFDAPGYRGMATGTEVAATKLMWALGYNVPENRIAYLRRQQLVVGAEAKFTPPGAAARPLRDEDIDRLLSRADRETDGSYRVVASKALPGTPIGRIRFAGVRPDDPNDIVAHEDRRELRGYGVFAAWLNHVDAKAINSLDTLITENGRSYVRHHLIDFGSALGSGGVAPADYWAGQETLMEPGRIARRMAGFGLITARWQTAPYYEAPSIGRLPGNHEAFDPDMWKPRVPNPAFLNARADDKFWAARRLMALTTDMLRAAVRTGEFGDAKSEDVLVRTLAQRRDAIGRAYLAAVNPIVDPALDSSGRLTFENAAVNADVAHAPREYRAVWSKFDNATGATAAIGVTTARMTSMQAPAVLPRGDGTFIRVELSAGDEAHPSWQVPVHAYFRLLQGGWKLIGFERQGS